MNETIDTNGFEVLFCGYGGVGTGIAVRIQEYADRVRKRRSNSRLFGDARFRSGLYTNVRRLNSAACLSSRFELDALQVFPHHASGMEPVEHVAEGDDEVYL